VEWSPRAKDYVLDFRTIEETAIIETPDGKYFVAHSHIASGWYQEYGKLKSKLAEIGLTPKKIKSDRFLTPYQVEALCRFLRVKLS